ncbi:hypothetical protein EXIGLDRAFT_732966 [Exidia glandulosa HHB12029]|uniref:Uncharacterized protein n=1 Tax=Exidia glandulosa HHB12029 TaxID=1314781 RepID=A0A165KLD1_EXIGL|nr:hypothetical protein EXIGLDRAFT_732966 [Exidia glandulosa HHB12029]
MTAAAGSSLLRPVRTPALDWVLCIASFWPPRGVHGPLFPAAYLLLMSAPTNHYGQSSPRPPVQRCPSPPCAAAVENGRTAAE